MGQGKRAWIYCAIDAPEDRNGALKSQFKQLIDYGEQMGFELVGSSSDVGTTPLWNRNGFRHFIKVNAPYQVPYKLKAASAALLHCFFGFLTTSGNFFDHGSRSSKNDRSLSSMRLGISVRRCSKYSYGFRLFAFAVSAML